MADIFNDGDDTTIDPNRDYLSEYVGEGKKFADAKELARAKAESDAHIARIEAENKEYRERMMQSRSVEDLMDQINERLSTNRQDPPNHGGDNEPNQTGTSVSPEDLDRIITEKMTAKQKADQEKANQLWVMQQLQKKYGAEFGRRVQEAAAELAMTKDEMNALASQKPKAFMKLVSDNQAPTSQPSFSPPNSRLNTQVESNSGEKNYAYYRKMRNENPKLYKSTRVQAEMHREAIKQGAAFFD